jgi:hypothetical protein
MKALSTTILIVVTAIVILVAALVVLTIFGGGIGNVASLSKAESVCRAALETTCSSTGAMPATWYVPTMTVTEGGKTEMKACSGISGIMNCICDANTKKVTGC